MILKKYLSLIIVCLIFCLSSTNFAQDDAPISPHFSGRVYKLLLPPISHDIEDVKYVMGEIHGRLSPSGRFVFASSEPFLFTNEGRFVQLEQFQYVWDLAYDSITERVMVVSYDLEMQLADVAGSKFAFSPDEQRLAFQHADELIILSVPDFEIITTVAIPQIDPSQRLGGTFERSLQIAWSPDSEVVVVITDIVYAISREGQIIGEQSLAEWDSIPEFATYYITPTSESVIFWFDWNPPLFISCDWILSNCDANGQGLVGSSLLVMPNNQEILTTSEQDSSQLLIWQKNEDGYAQQLEPIPTSSELFRISTNSSGEYVLGGKFRNGFSNSGVVIRYPSGEILNEFSFEGLFDFQWLPDGEHFITFDYSSQGENSVNLRLYKVGQDEPVDSLGLNSDDLEGMEINLDFMNIVNVSDDGQTVLISLGGTLLVVPVSYN